jgi:hypothetical protein
LVRLLRSRILTVATFAEAAVLFTQPFVVHPAESAVRSSTSDRFLWQTVSTRVCRRTISAARPFSIAELTGYEAR